MSSLDFFEEQVFFTAPKITATEPLTGRVSSGTGFLFRVPLPAPYESKAVVLLVTCRHVLFEGAGQITIKFHARQKENPTLPDLSQHVVIGPGTYSSGYYAHDDPEVDVAAINISNIVEHGPNIFLKTIGTHNCANFSHRELVPNKEIFFVGYPNALHDELHNLPILRAGRIASMPKVDFNGKPEFLIDAQVFPGSSGSAVYTTLGAEAFLLGIVGKSFFRNAPVQELVHTTGHVIQDFLGLGVVYKISAVQSVAEKVISHIIAGLNKKEPVAGGSVPAKEPASEVGHSATSAQLSESSA